MRKVVITGGTGYLGSRLVRSFLDTGDRVELLSRGGMKRSLADLRERIGLHSLDRKGLEDATRDSPADLFIHAGTCYGRDGETDCEILEANFLTPLAIYGASTGCVDRWIIVGTGLAPDVSKYAMSKSLLPQWLRSHGVAIPWTELRLQHFYGPGEEQNRFLTHVASACLAGAALDLTDGRQARDFIHVDDVVSAVRCVGESMALPSGTPVEIGSGAALPVRKVVEMIHRFAHSSSELKFGAIPMRPNEPEICVADTQTLGRLGWNPQVALEDGLRALVQGLSSTIQREGEK